MNRAQLLSGGTPTPRRVPEAFLRAEIAAFPLASEKSFLQALVELDPKFPEESKTGDLWRECECQFAPHTGWSLDRLVAARDRGWFGPSMRGIVPMHVYLSALARSYLVPRAGVTEMNESTDLTAVDVPHHYRWLTLALPEDLLLGGLGVEPAPVRVDADPPLLRRRLIDLGVTEIHQHVGAGMDFPLLWASALAAVATPDVEEHALAMPGAPLSDGKDLVRWLLAAAIARCVVAQYLLVGGQSFDTFLRSSFLSSKDTAWTRTRRDVLRALLTALLTAAVKDLPDIELLRDLYADFHPTALLLEEDPIKSIDDAFRRCDPIAVRLHLQGNNAGERWFIRTSFAHLNNRHRSSRSTQAEAADQKDEYFACVFWQVVRIRCQYYRAVVQRPLTGGLQWFMRFYDRLGRFRNPVDSIRPECSYRIAGKGQPIRALELRETLGNTSIAIGEELLSFLRSWKNVLEKMSSSAFEPEIGVIFHFVKSRAKELGWSKGVPPAFWSGTFAEPGSESGVAVAHGRYVEYFANQCRKCLALAELIKDVPSLLWVIRGLDVATDELGVPTWVLVPLFRHLIDESARVSMHDEGLTPLRVTAHVGEDFRHLLEGMRRIYEHIHYVMGAAPGRLGHAIALGVEPRAWSESVGSVLMPAEERLWDLVWEWRLYTKYRIKPEYVAEAPRGRVAILQNQIRQLSDYIFVNVQHVHTIEELAEAHDVLHRFLVPPFSRTPAVEGGHMTFLDAVQNIMSVDIRGRVHSPKDVSDILRHYLDDETTFLRGQTLVDIPLDIDEVKALEAVQHALRCGIARQRVVVEVNPSSNLLIGDLLDLRNHPILRLNPPVREQDGPPPVAIALGSDDPLTFSTNLLREYTLLYEAACAAGYPERVVLEWLESIRRTGMDARFTLAWRPSAKKKTDELIGALCTYLHEPESCVRRPGCHF
jgi:hypothetical protein